MEAYKRPFKYKFDDIVCDKRDQVCNKGVRWNRIILAIIIISIIIIIVASCIYIGQQYQYEDWIAPTFWSIGGSILVTSMCYFFYHNLRDRSREKRFNDIMKLEEINNLIRDIEKAILEKEKLKSKLKSERTKLNLKEGNIKDELRFVWQGVQIKLHDSAKSLENILTHIQINIPELSSIINKLSSVKTKFTNISQSIFNSTTKQQLKECQEEIKALLLQIKEIRDKTIEDKARAQMSLVIDQLNTLEKNIDGSVDELNNKDGTQEGSYDKKMNKELIPIHNEIIDLKFPDKIKPFVRNSTYDKIIDKISNMYNYKKKFPTNYEGYTVDYGHDNYKSIIKTIDNNIFGIYNNIVERVAENLNIKRVFDMEKHKIIIDESYTHLVDDDKKLFKLICYQRNPQYFINNDIKLDKYVLEINNNYSTMNNRPMNSQQKDSILLATGVFSEALDKIIKYEFSQYSEKTGHIITYDLDMYIKNKFTEKMKNILSDNKHTGGGILISKSDYAVFEFYDRRLHNRTNMQLLHRLNISYGRAEDNSNEMTTIKINNSQNDLYKIQTDIQNLEKEIIGKKQELENLKRKRDTYIEINSYYNSLPIKINQVNQELNDIIYLINIYNKTKRVEDKNQMANSIKSLSNKYDITSILQSKETKEIKESKEIKDFINKMENPELLTYIAEVLTLEESNIFNTNKKLYLDTINIFKQLNELYLKIIDIDLKSSQWDIVIPHLDVFDKFWQMNHNLRSYTADINFRVNITPLISQFDSTIQKYRILLKEAIATRVNLIKLNNDINDIQNFYSDNIEPYKKYQIFNEYIDHVNNEYENRIAEIQKNNEASNNTSSENSVLDVDGTVAHAKSIFNFFSPK